MDGKAQMQQHIGPILRRVREQRPLLHHITNFVTMNDVANASLHIGATPVMAHAAEEVAEMVSKAQALVLNMGTLTPDRLEAMLIAGRAANASSVPIVLDPVGVGATDMRQAANQRILSELDVALVRGNAAEIGVLAGAGGTMQGVDSLAGAAAPIAVTRQLAQTHGMVVAMTGKRDIISDGERVAEVSNGHLWLTKLSGTGCMATAVVAAMAAVEPDHFVAAVAGLAAYGVAAELAAVEAWGPASFKVAFFDQLYYLTERQVTDGARLTIH
ncbi:hydroxyethylthiazole kinase [Candidatus Entotheonella palauensis]|uniref:Hydroxyethylthiazole kinase n=1 Tax=Candidatus Entotheonella gemina TaxID=1429439 RepID=W4M3Z8_9BACT|nr:hydroxyethylthiazole kinase [Candidatus Entotheonella palauensis]ETX05084.1 MAG: hydroxyethylthiazole kinase [Candidatus Entotheonella gemina]